jgi:hypothetical protein
MDAKQPNQLSSIPSLIRHSAADPSTSDCVDFTDWVLDGAVPRLRAQRLVSLPKSRLGSRADESDSGSRFTGMVASTLVFC